MKKRWAGAQLIVNAAVCVKIVVRESHSFELAGLKKQEERRKNSILAVW